MSSTRKPARFDTARRWLASRAPWFHRTLRPGWRAINRVVQVETYWAARKHLRYYQEVVGLARTHVPSGGAVLDVGAATTEVLLALDWFRRRVALDLNRALEHPDVESIVVDFMDYAPPAPFDLVLCLQVIEHVEDPQAFLRKLLATGRVVIVSVPYKWPPGRVTGHRHDPVDEVTLERWAGRPPVDRVLVGEARDREARERLIAVWC